MGFHGCVQLVKNFQDFFMDFIADSAALKRERKKEIEKNRELVLKNRQLEASGFFPFNLFLW